MGPVGLESGMTWDGAGITWGWCWDDGGWCWDETCYMAQRPRSPDICIHVATGWQICQPTGPCPPCNAALAQRLIHLSSFLRLSRALDHAARAGWVCTAAKVRSVVSLIFSCWSNKESGGALWPASDSSSSASFAASAAFIASICVAWHLIVSFTADTEGSGQIPCTLTCLALVSLRNPVCHTCYGRFCGSSVSLLLARLCLLTPRRLCVLLRRCSISSLGLLRVRGCQRRAVRAVLPGTARLCCQEQHAMD